MENEVDQARADGIEAKLDEVRAHVGEIENVLGVATYVNVRSRGIVDPAATLEHLCCAFAALKRAKDSVEAALDQIKDAQIAIGAAIEPRFQESGVQSVNIDGVSVYLRRDISGGFEEHGFYHRRDPDTGEIAASYEGRAALVEALADFPGSAHLIRRDYAHQSLGSWIRDDLPRDENDVPIVPDPLIGVLKINERFDVRCVKAGASKSRKKI